MDRCRRQIGRDLNDLNRFLPQGEDVAGLREADAPQQPGPPKPPTPRTPSRYRPRSHVNRVPSPPLSCSSWVLRLGGWAPTPSLPPRGLSPSVPKGSTAPVASKVSGVSQRFSAEFAVEMRLRPRAGNAGKKNLARTQLKSH